MKKLIRRLRPYYAYILIALIFVPTTFWGSISQKLSALTSGPRYTIESYQGELHLLENDNAYFTQDITYQFKSDYRGQYVTVGSVNPLPDGFTIGEHPYVTVKTNGRQHNQFSSDVSYWSDGKQLRIYNPGKKGDQVQIRVTWPLSHILQHHTDIQELNWFPISDWDKPIKQVTFRVIGSDGATGKLYAHTGFFGPEAKVSQTAKSYTVRVDNLPKKGKLELHAYWPQKNQATESNGNRLADFLQVEKGIEQKTALYRTVFGLILPVIILVLVLISGVMVFIFYRLTQVKKPYSAKSTLTKAPQIISPLLLAKLMYKQGVLESFLHPRRSKVTFDHLIQSGIFDMIRQSKILYIVDGDEVRLQLESYDDLPQYEKDLVDLVFGDDFVIYPYQMFKPFRVDEVRMRIDMENARTIADQQDIRDYGERKRQRFEQALEKLDLSLDAEIESQNLQSPYRSLSKLEDFLYISALVLDFLAILIVSVAATYVYKNVNLISWPLIASLAVLLVLTWLTYAYLKKASRFCLDPKKAYTYFKWRRYEKAINEIKTFSKSELKAFDEWDVLIVYATLFGKMPLLSQAVTFHDIAIPIDTFDRYSHHYHDFPIVHHSRNIHETMDSIDDISHFTIPSSHSDNNDSGGSSSSGGGGSSGGGFSGGGGGGGGGAF